MIRTLSHAKLSIFQFFALPLKNDTLDTHNPINDCLPVGKNIHYVLYKRFLSYTHSPYNLDYRYNGYRVFFYNETISKGVHSGDRLHVLHPVPLLWLPASCQNTVPQVLHLILTLALLFSYMLR